MESDEFDGSTEALTVAQFCSRQCLSKFIVITGATVGSIGFESARVLAKYGAEVFITCRSEEACRKAASEIQTLNPIYPIQYHILDLASFASIQRFAEHFLGLNRGIDVLINNAGTMQETSKVTEDGFEHQWQVNYLGQFYLTQLLLPALTKAGTRERPSRVIMTSSVMNIAFCSERGIDFKALSESKIHKDGMRRYSESKLAVIMFAKELSRRMIESGEEEKDAVAYTPTYSNVFIDDEQEVSIQDDEDEFQQESQESEEIEESEIQSYLDVFANDHEATEESEDDENERDERSHMDHIKDEGNDTPSLPVYDKDILSDPSTNPDTGPFQRVIAVALHPGIYRYSRIFRTLKASRLMITGWKLFKSGRRKLLKEKHKTLSQAAATTVFCALHPNRVHPGKYYADCMESGLLHPQAEDIKACKMLWELSERQIEQRVPRAVSTTSLPAFSIDRPVASVSSPLRSVSQTVSTSSPSRMISSQLPLSPLYVEEIVPAVRETEMYSERATTTLEI